MTQYYCTRCDLATFADPQKGIPKPIKVANFLLKITPKSSKFGDIAPKKHHICGENHQKFGQFWCFWGASGGPEYWKTQNDTLRCAQSGKGHSTLCFSTVLNDFMTFPKSFILALRALGRILWNFLDATRILEVRFCFPISEFDGQCVAGIPGAPLGGPPVTLHGRFVEKAMFRKGFACFLSIRGKTVSWRRIDETKQAGTQPQYERSRAT